MAEISRIVELTGDETVPAWQSIIDLDRAGLSESLTLVGGLMVYAHARAATLSSTRPTADADVLVDVVAARTSLAEVQAVLRDLGFALNTDYDTAYRFRHSDDRVIDVMVADHLPSHIRARLSGRPAFQAPAGQQAINRREVWRLEFSPDLVCSVGIPNTLGALVAKGAAWMVDTRNPERHLQDSATLLAAVGDASALDYRLSHNDRRRLRAIHAHLRDERHPAWGLLEEQERREGQQNLELIAGGAGL
ncbi:hypothetical protein N1031_12875 [Herbiconiux moechotypicola]|uniref:Nucleotidyltransferase family protein n=1 Tax=Herbiconiux moechotypicola TaxID=637393 RepID=A0ABN3DS44_9MICO|nr:hypothetical protein [Herbiconiux moechotypicola]MCS5730657.1 hypothetical protein [Herbiconiux moechotypicola]